MRISYHKKPKLTHNLKPLFLGIGVFLYEIIASMQPLLPPLLGVALVLFIRYDESDDFYAFLAVIFGLFVIEIENNLPMGMILGLFVFIYALIVPRIQSLLDTPRLAKVTYALCAYVGFYLLGLGLDFIFGSEITPSFWLLLYYLALEIIVVIFL